MQAHKYDRLLDLLFDVIERVSKISFCKETSMMFCNSDKNVKPYICTIIKTWN